MIVLEKSRVYAVCKLERGSPPFQNPFSDDVNGSTTRTARQINQTLNLALGRPDWLDRQRNQRLVKVIDFINRFCLIWWEEVIFKLINIIPVSWRRAVIYSAWKVYFPIHKYLWQNNPTAIHKDASAEYHALYTTLWFGRYFPVTIPRMRFLLSQLTALSPPRNQDKSYYCPPEYIVNANVDVPEDTMFIPEKYADHAVANGIYLKRQNEDTPSDYVLLWFYGGAFLSGDALGNIGPAECVADGSMDVFIPTIRLAPEVNIYGVLWDVVVSLRYLQQRRIKEGQDPTKIMVFGCSSGGALVMRLLQLTSKQREDASSINNDDVVPEFLTPILRGLHPPASAAILSPFVDFQRNKDPNGSFHQYVVHDLIVNESVQESALPYLDTHMNVNPGEDHSPLAYPNVTGLPPLLILLSEHETVHDETIRLIHQLQAADADITVGYYRYMCHVWSFYHGFLPEGQHAMQLMARWLRSQQQR